MVTFKDLGIMGELGNQFFQIACTLAQAQKRNDIYVFPKWFCKKSQIDYSNFFVNSINEQKYVDYSMFKDYRYEKIPYREIPTFAEENINLRGYFQSEKYFENVKEEVKKMFTPVDSVYEKIKKIDFSNSVSLQVRFYDRNRLGGNPLNFGHENPEGYHNLAKEGGYFSEAIKYFGPNKTYIINSNNPILAKQLLNLPDAITLDSKIYNNIDQFFIQTLCEHNVISNSTFGWWGAYLNNNPDKIVFAPKRWFTFEQVNTEEIFPKEWRVLP
jgi:hypothetical protein